MINISNISKKYGNGDEILKGIDLEIYREEFVAIMGPSGSGKTTLLNAMSTIDKSTSGKIEISGRNITNIKDKELSKFRRDTVGFVFQNFNLLDNMSIRDNIALPLVLNNVENKLILKKINELSSLLGIKKHLDKYPYQLSGGERQRAAICRALIMEPKVIFADEPTGSLDSKSTKDVLNCFKSINKELKTTIVMVTHDANAASFCDRVFFLEDGSIYGKLDSDGDNKDLLKRTLNMLAIIGGGSDEFI
ncbi:ABC transporter ATP-binding protein [Clostridium gasigenes]|nr:ABC transporter ATP-binding protein [Clostridium gasigenes]